MYYRLDVIDISLPPLKDRGEDAIIMANIFLKNYAGKIGKDIRRVHAGSRYRHPDPWLAREYSRTGEPDSPRRGNGRWDHHNSGKFRVEIRLHQPGTLFNGLGLKEAKAKFEAELVSAALKRYRGSVQLAAKALKTSRSVVYHLMQKYEIRQVS